MENTHNIEKRIRIEIIEEQLFELREFGGEYSNSFEEMRLKIHEIYKELLIK